MCVHVLFVVDILHVIVYSFYVARACKSVHFLVKLMTIGKKNAERTTKNCMKSFLFHYRYVCSHVICTQNGTLFEIVRAEKLASVGCSINFAYIVMILGVLYVFTKCRERKKEENRSIYRTGKIAVYRGSDRVWVVILDLRWTHYITVDRKISPLFIALQQRHTHTIPIHT